MFILKIAPDFITEIHVVAKHVHTVCEYVVGPDNEKFTSLI